MKKQISVLLLLITFGTHISYADVMKCLVKKNPAITNYFESTNKKENKRCLSKPVAVVNSAGEKIKNQYRAKSSAPNIKNDQSQPKPLAAKDVKPMGCNSTGGTVKVNGRVFHLDPAALCRKYGSKSKGSITAGSKRSNYLARHVKLNAVDSDFRRKIAAYVNKTSRKYRMDPAFIHAVISAESAYKPNAKSHAGAMGLMQLMPFTAKRFGVTNAYNPYQNVEAGVKYLRILLDEFGSLELAAAGYNAGEGSVRKYNRKIPPYKETMKYVPKVMAYYRKYKKNRSLIASR